MCKNKLRRWLLVTFVAVGCNAKLSVAPDQSGGSGGTQQAGAAGSPVVAGGGGQPSGGAGAGSGGRLIGDGGAGSAGAQVAGACSCPAVGGAAGAPPTQGNLGQPCISGATISSGSGVAATAVTTLDHCSRGLACSAAGKCVTMPNCPQAVGPCVVAEVVPSDPSMEGASGSGGSAGSAGASSISDISGVTGMSADDTKLYWLEYGTRDTLGNYRGDGALMAMDLATGERTPLLSHLPGPFAFGLTTTQVFVFVNGGGLIGSSAHAQLLRFPLQGGEATVIQEGSPPLSTNTRGFVSSGDQAFWAGASELYSLSGSSTTPSLLSSATYAEPEAADSETLFFSVGDSFLSTPLSGGAATPLSIEHRPIGLNGDFVYGLESADGGTLLTRAAKSNGAWQRIRALGGGTARTIKMTGDRYFWAWYVYNQYTDTSAISTASLSDSLPPTQIVGLDEDRALYWAGTASKLYWSDGKRIFSRSFVNQ